LSGSTSEVGLAVSLGRGAIRKVALKRIKREWEMSNFQGTLAASF